MQLETVEKQAKALAVEHRKSDPDIQQVLWFPDELEVRLIDVTPLTPRADDDEIHPFYFRAAPNDDLPLQSGIALVRPEEVGKLRLPHSWGDWSRAIIVA